LAETVGARGTQHHHGRIGDRVGEGRIMHMKKERTPSKNRSSGENFDGEEKLSDSLILGEGENHSFSEKLSLRK